MKVTNHANARMKERLGIKSAKRRIRMAELALERGRVVEIENRDCQGVSQSRMVLQYQEGLFVFASDLSLVTVMNSKKKSYVSKTETLACIYQKESKEMMRCA